MTKKHWIGAVVVFIILMLLDYVVHEIILMSAYDATSDVWRAREDMKNGAMIISSLIFSIFFVLVFSKGYEGKGLGEGVRYGFIIGMFFAVPQAYTYYAVLPIPYSLALQWWIYSTVEFVIAGAVLSKVMDMGGGSSD